MRKNEIIKNLELLGQQIKMTDEQKQRSEDFIMSRIKSDLFIEEKNTVPIWLKLADAFVPANFRLQPVAVFSLVIGLFFVTSFASINASKNTLPGDPLYQIKITAVDSSYWKKEYFADRPPSERLENKKLDLRKLNVMRDWRICLKEYLNDYYSDYL